jgi:hypothetical protein
VVTVKMMSASLAVLVGDLNCSLGYRWCGHNHQRVRNLGYSLFPIYL